MSERRQDVRISGPFEGHWHGGSGATEVRIADISLGGCFVETVLQPVAGEETEVSIQFADGQSITLHGRVAYVDPGVGFGLAFRRPLTTEETTFLSQHLHLDA
jgi:hypothetical protein